MDSPTKPAADTGGEQSEDISQQDTAQISAIAQFLGVIGLFKASNFAEKKTHFDRLTNPNLASELLDFANPQKLASINESLKFTAGQIRKVKKGKNQAEARFLFWHTKISVDDAQRAQRGTAIAKSVEKALKTKEMEIRIQRVINIYGLKGEYTDTEQIRERVVKQCQEHPEITIEEALAIESRRLYLTQNALDEKSLDEKKTIELEEKATDVERQNQTARQEAIDELKDGVIKRGEEEIKKALDPEKPISPEEEFKQTIQYVLNGPEEKEPQIPPAQTPIAETPPAIETPPTIEVPPATPAPPTSVPPYEPTKPPPPTGKTELEKEAQLPSLQQPLQPIIAPSPKTGVSLQKPPAVQIPQPQKPPAAIPKTTVRSPFAIMRSALSIPKLPSFRPLPTIRLPFLGNALSRLNTLNTLLASLLNKLIEIGRFLRSLFTPVIGILTNLGTFIIRLGTNLFSLLRDKTLKSGLNLFKGLGSRALTRLLATPIPGVNVAVFLGLDKFALRAAGFAVLAVVGIFLLIILGMGESGSSLISPYTPNNPMTIKASLLPQTAYRWQEFEKEYLVAANYVNNNLSWKLFEKEYLTPKKTYLSETK